MMHGRAGMHGFGPGHDHGLGLGHDHDDEDGHEHRYPGAKRGFRRLHPEDHHRDLRTETVTTDTPQA